MALDLVAGGEVIEALALGGLDGSVYGVHDPDELTVEGGPVSVHVRIGLHESRAEAVRAPPGSI